MRHAPPTRGAGLTPPAIIIAADKTENYEISSLILWLWISFIRNTLIYYHHLT